MSVKRPKEGETVDESELFKFVCLGAGNEVGRSCHVISYKGKTIMLDTGVHPAHSGLASLPFYDEYDLSTIDILLISHFHLDHAASLPYVVRHTNFKGRVFMTHPTKAIFRWLLSDFVKVSGSPDAAQPLYTEEDLVATYDIIETVDYHSTLLVDGIKFTAYHAGHVLGAAMFLVEIGGLTVLFTGDYSREEDRHLNQAEVPVKKPDILICESTYGIGTHQPRPEKEKRLTDIVHNTVANGGRCLLPVFALGRAQEILLILDEYWSKHESELSGINVYYASNLAKRCMAVFQTYVNMMNDNIRKRLRDDRTNPFIFKHIKNLKSLDRFDDIGPCVMVASPGMLQSGISRQLLERWAPDPKNSLIMTGYSVEGTLAKSIINEPQEIASVSNPEVKVPRRISVDELSFAAHVDFTENSGFIDEIGAKHVILVHGEKTNMARLKNALMSKYVDRKGTENEVKVYNPRNCYEVEVPFKSVKYAKVVGRLAEKPREEGHALSGVLVEKDFNLKLVDISDLREYAGLTTSVVTEKQQVVVNAGPDLVRYHLEQMFGSVEIIDENNSDNSATFEVMGAVRIDHVGNQTTVEWIGNVMNDAIADSVLAVLLSVDSSPASVKLSSHSCGCGDAPVKEEVKQENGTSNGATTTSTTTHDHDSTADKVAKICAILRAQFGDALQLADDNETATIRIDTSEAHVNFKTLEVDCASKALKTRVSHVLERAINTVAPLARDMNQLNPA